MAAATASADSIPSDVLCNICEHSLPSILGDPQTQRFGATPPFNISMVCRAWRVVVLNQPSLWSRIRLDKLSVTSSWDERVVKGLELWLRRSSGVPLTISARIALPTYEDVVLRVISLIFAEQHRWRNVDLVITCPGPVAPAVPPPQALKISSSSLAFLSCDLNQYLRGNTLVLDLARSLMLEEMTIHGSAKFIVPSVPAELANLRSLTLNSPDVLNLEECHALLCASPNLSSIKITAGANVQPVQPQSPLVHLPQLTHLTLNLKNALALPSLLNHLACPCLCTLSIDVPGRAPPVEHLHAVREFLSRSSPPLTRLRLCRKPAAKRDSNDAQEDMAHTLVRIVRRLNSLEEFNISGFAVSNQLVSELHMQETISWRGRNGRSSQGVGDSEVNLCPRLRIFRIAWCEYTIEPQTMAAMLSSRWKYGSLVTVSINLWDFERIDQTSKDIRQCVKEGLLLSISSYAE